MALAADQSLEERAYLVAQALLAHVAIALDPIHLQAHIIMSVRKKSMRSLFFLAIVLTFGLVLGLALLA